MCPKRGILKAAVLPRGILSASIISGFLTRTKERKMSVQGDAKLCAMHVLPCNLQQDEEKKLQTN